MSEAGHEPDLGPWEDEDGILLAIQKPYRDGQALRGTLLLKVKDTGEILTREDVKLVSGNFKRFLSNAKEMCPKGKDTINSADLLPIINDLKNRSKIQANQQVRTEQSASESPEPLDEKYSEERMERARELLEDEEMLCKVKSVLDHKIAGEDRTKLSLFLQMLSKETESPLMIFGIQKQGQGKSFIAKNVIDLFPENQVKKVTKMTKAALYRSAQKDPNRFEGKIVFFGEIPENDDERHIFQIFRQLVSEGQVTKELVIEENGNQHVRELKLEGAPCLVTTTTNPDLIDEQDRSRGVTYSPDTSERQNKRVREFQKSRRKFPDGVNEPPKIQQLENDIETALDIVSRQDFNVLNPYVEDLDNLIPEESPNIRRDFNKILQITAELPALLHHKNRRKIEDDSTSHILVSYKDVFRGLAIQRKTIQNMLEGRSQLLLDVYEEITERVEPNANDHEGMRQMVENELIEDRKNLDTFEISDVKRWMNIEYGPARRIMKALDEMELVYKDTSTRPHQHFLVDEELENGGLSRKRVKKTLARVIDGENAQKWLKNFSDRTGNAVKGGSAPVSSELVPAEREYPLKIRTGLGGDDTLPLPEHLHSQENKSKLISAVSVNENGSIIF
nr:MAG: hypothetical protein J07AB56_09040 [Candidatus Nanosalinarum sp. J07AB56]